MKIVCYQYNIESCSVIEVTEETLSTVELTEDFVYWLNFELMPTKNTLAVLAQKLNFENQPWFEKLFVTDSHSIFENQQALSLTLKMLEYDKILHRIKQENTTLVLAKNVVITIQDGKEGDLFVEIRNKIKSLQSLLNQKNSEYLLYRLLNAVEKSNQNIVDQINIQLLDIDSFIANANSLDELKGLFRLKRELIFLRKNTSPLRELLNQLCHTEDYVFHEDTYKNLCQLADHTQYLIENIDLNRDMLSGILEFHISSNGYKMNNIMKLLTIISTVFIPLGFVVGYFGMNFTNLPLLNNPYGFIYVSSFMLLASLGMLLYFKAKRWI